MALAGDLSEFPLTDIIQLVDKVLFETTGTRADVMISAQSSRRSFMCFIVPTNVGGMEAVSSVKTALLNRLPELADPAAWDIQPVSIVTAIARNLDQLLGLDARILQQLEGIQSVALAEGPSRCSLSVVIHPDNTDDALQRIHQLTLDDAATVEHLSEHLVEHGLTVSQGLSLTLQ